MRVRDMIRRLGPNCLLTPTYVERYLDIEPDHSAELIAELEQQGFIQKWSEDKDYWQPTLKGSALALATAAKPIKRKSAERILKEFFERVEVVQRDPHYLLRVERIDLFGSMTTAQDTVNDIDLGILCKRKEENDDLYEDLANESRRLAQERGRRFAGHADWLMWPTTNVLLFLRSRSRALSLHPLDEWVLQQPGRRTIYIARDDGPGQQLLFQTDGL